MEKKLIDSLMLVTFLGGIVIFCAVATVLATLHVYFNLQVTGGMLCTTLFLSTVAGGVLGIVLEWDDIKDIEE